MPTLIKNIANKHLIVFDKGKFDEWCIYLTRAGGPKYAPLDTEYFTILQNLGEKHGHRVIYNDFVQLFSATTKVLCDDVLNLTGTLAAKYGEDAEEVEIWLTVIYAGMIAEENKAHAVLGKRIKRLGMYQVLIEKLSPDYAANFSKGKKWRELDAVMKGKGF